MVLPRRIKINGRNVEVPDLHPNLLELKDKRGRTTGYYRRHANTDEINIPESEAPEIIAPMRSPVKKKRRRNTDRATRTSIFTAFEDEVIAKY